MVGIRRFKRKQNQYISNDNIANHDRSEDEIIEFSDIRLIDNIYNNTLIELSKSNKATDISHNIISDIRQLSQAEICLFKLPIQATESNTENIAILHPNHNIVIYQKIINILSSSPKLHNKFSDLDEISKVSNAIILLNSFRNINIKNLSGIYLNLSENMASNEIYGSLFIYSNNKYHKQTLSSSFKQKISIALTNFALQQFIINYQHNHIKNSHVKLETAIRLLKEVQHDSNHALAIINQSAMNIAKQNNYNNRIKIAKRLKGTSLLLNNNIDKLSWIFTNKTKLKKNQLIENKNQWINLIYWLKTLYSAFIDQAKSKNISFILLIENTIPDNIKINEKAISQVTFNFLSNAFKYTQKGYVVLEITASKKANEIWSINISVQDSGCGIEKENHSNVFTNSFRENEALNGTGIGLTLCKNAARMIDGTLSFSSIKNLGSRFKFDFSTEANFTYDNDFIEKDKLSYCTYDLHIDHGTCTNAFIDTVRKLNILNYDDKLITINKSTSKNFWKRFSSHETSTCLQVVLLQSKDESIRNRYLNSEVIYQPNQDIRIAFIDDDHNIIEYWRGLLNNAGYKVESFTSADTAMQEIQSHPHTYNLLISDFNLGSSISGISLVRCLRELDIIIPAILMTAEDLENVTTEALNSGINKVISKTIDLQTMTYEIKELLFKDGIEFTAQLINDNSFLDDNIKKANIVEKNKIQYAEANKYLPIIARTISQLGDPNHNDSTMRQKIRIIDSLLDTYNNDELYKELHNLKNLSIILKMPPSMLIMKLKAKEIKDKDTLSPSFKKRVQEACEEFMNYYADIHEYVKKGPTCK